MVVEQVPLVYPLNTQAEKTEAVCTMSVTRPNGHITEYNFKQC